MRNLTVTLVQSEIKWHQSKQNCAHFKDIILHLEEDTDLIVLPEMFNTGFTMSASEHVEQMSGVTVAWMQELASEVNAVIVGSLPIMEQGKFYNRLIWMQADGHYKTYDKRHLFRNAGEHEHYSPGGKRLVVELHGWKVCPLICYDLRFPVWSRNRDDYDLLIYIANWPARRRLAWQTLLPARAIENLCYVVGVNRIGSDENEHVYKGDSGVYDCLGNELVQASDEMFVETLELDYIQLHQFREKFPFNKDADDFVIQD